MSKTILVNASTYETRVATLENGEIRSLHIEREEDRNVVGNIYKGVVKRVLPGMQAAFLELGLERTAFLYVDDIVEDPFGGDIEYEGEMEDDDGSGPSTAGSRGEDDQGSEDDDDWDDSEEPLEGEPLDGEPDTELKDSEPVDPADKEKVEAKVPLADKEFDDKNLNADRERPARAPRDRDDRGGDRDRGPRRDRPAREDRPRDDRPPREARDNRGPREDRPREDRPPRDDRPRDDRAPREDRPRDDRPREERDAGPDDRDASPRQPRGPRGRKDHARGGGRGGGGGRQGGRDRGRGRRFPPRRQRGTANIQDLLKEGQEILVQVAKAPIGTKGARLTTHISLPGRNVVLMPTVKHLGISRRIASERERRRLREMFVKRIRPRGVGFIIRTVAEGKGFRDLKADADYLINLWEKVKVDSQRKKAPAMIHEDLSLGMRAVRDFFTDEVDSFIIDNAEEYENVLAFIAQFMPRLKNRVKLFKGPSQLFEHYGIEAEISRALGKKVWLKSGGYLLVDQSEALTAIDVNTGRYVGSKSLEETILKTNLEAVKEIAYQMRIRNVGGIIIIDLIDMENQENREKVYHALQDALGEDRARTNILKISELGLVEMTRKRTHEDLVRYLTESCGNCDGRGYHKSRQTVCFEIFREIEKEALSPSKNIVVFAHPNVTEKMLGEEKEHVKLLETRFSKHITVKTDTNFHVEQYEVFGKN